MTCPYKSCNHAPVRDAPTEDAELCNGVSKEGEGEGKDGLVICVPCYLRSKRFCDRFFGEVAPNELLIRSPTKSWSSPKRAATVLAIATDQCLKGLWVGSGGKWPTRMEEPATSLPMNAQRLVEGRVLR